MRAQAQDSKYHSELVKIAFNSIIYHLKTSLFLFLGSYPYFKLIQQNFSHFAQIFCIFASSLCPLQKHNYSGLLCLMHGFQTTSSNKKSPEKPKKAS